MAISDIIETKRLWIKPFEKTHVSQTYISWLNDPEVVKYSNQRFKNHTLENCEKYRQSFENTPNYFWAIEVKESNIHIGTMTAYVDPHSSVADIGILIGYRQSWGKGYGSEAWKAVCDYLLNRVQLRKLTAGTMAINKPMLGIMRSAGMENDGIKKRHFIYDGQEVNGIYMALFKNKS